MLLDDERLRRLNDNRLYRTLGIVMTEVEEGFAASRMQAPPNVCWPAEAQPHGGIVFLLMDTTSATAVMTTMTEEQRCSTIDMQIQYLRAAAGEHLECRAHAIERTTRMCFVRGEIRNPAGELVALGQGTFRVFSSNHGIQIT